MGWYSDREAGLENQSYEMGLNQAEWIWDNFQEWN